MVTKGGAKKKAKVRAYDIEESKKIFLYAYEHQLKNEKVNWKRAEESKVTSHSASSMRSHYVNCIKHEVSLYLEMYSEEVAKLFNKVKKWKKEEKKKKMILFQSSSLVKQRSNISLDRVTKGKSKNYNKFNSLIISKAFSMKGNRSVSSKQNCSINRRNVATANKKKSKKDTTVCSSASATASGGRTKGQPGAPKSSLKKKKIKKVKFAQKDPLAVKDKKIDKKIDKNVAKSAAKSTAKNAPKGAAKNAAKCVAKIALQNNAIPSSNVERTNNPPNNSFNTDMSDKTEKRKSEKERGKHTRVSENYQMEAKDISQGSTESRHVKKKVKEENETQMNVDGTVHCQRGSNALNEVGHIKIPGEEHLHQKYHLESRPAKRHSDKNSPLQSRAKRGKHYAANCNSKEFIRTSKPYDTKMSSGNVREGKRSSISSIFGYIYDKIFR
ncbi:conserved Plasmodium protein, unknown function [Plasmodium vivax]|uniref:Uncharacterized protein n=5 Tax=Plasmodium vivax TaxID=5855 RepID=A5K199_PLAVS|nr:hypothetical protein PVX_085800 [Plasmodium vivax]KMZ78286.1 hypothetical protein PVIIG_02285 [Plasmodium vivax India VII]KMZ83891.1 hypothetical protein PVBG_00971 [Plasmodium vivax Brazil I]KMZ97413.1 hypothetical protein PVNG_01243 [Plasmodium vivax North Korean]EDL47096.1 hypothetical protein PVX_085800 [Plasmodium vivax]CAG9476166.1 unnamed protein product [Plasmodium vivax]|eukprot:XP_001616823.1 hypothetical protein [Plasmodium vivax Sal-1]